MQENDLKTLLSNYQPIDHKEREYKIKILHFLKNQPLAYLRESLEGHITGSAFVVNQHFTKTLLIKHAKLNRWQQPGGHCDGEKDVANVAIKETIEETGLHDLVCLQDIFDIDIHTIPARKNVEEHLHYDIRFLIIASEAEKLKISDESTDIQWVKFSDIKKFTQENSILRMVEKVKYQKVKLSQLG
jgi:8-oxo-dGTP pyrophosphatase MutT (NUDIX family)